MKIIHKKNLSKHQLEQMYLVNGMSLSMIMTLTNRGYKAINHLMKKYKIPRRKKGNGWYKNY